MFQGSKRKRSYEFTGFRAVGEGDPTIFIYTGSDATDFMLESNKKIFLRIYRFHSSGIKSDLLP